MKRSAGVSQHSWVLVEKIPCLGMTVPSVVAHVFTDVFDKQRQLDLCELKASMVYRASSTSGRPLKEDLAWFSWPIPACVSHGLHM